jgi:formiminoglutamase
MFDNWLKSITKNDTIKIQNLDGNSLYQQILDYDKDKSKLPKVDFAIITLDSKTAIAVHKALSEMSVPNYKVKVIDLGVSRSNESNFITPVIKELIQSKIIPIIIGGSIINTLSQFNAYPNTSSINCSIVEEKLMLTKDFDVETYYFKDIVKHLKAKLFNLSIVGLQRHFVSSYATKFSNSKSFSIVGLGEILHNINDAELTIRDADMLSINLKTLKSSEIIDQKGISPSGLNSEQMCQLTRFAGASDKCTSLGIYGFENLEPDSSSAKIIAQMLWYFFEGFYNRTKSFPVSLNNLEKFKIPIDDINKDLIFYFNNLSDKWWIEMPVSSKKHLKHALIPVSRLDYEAAKEGNMTERVMKIIHRYL